jgi:hypothetical protein
VRGAFISQAKHILAACAVILFAVCSLSQLAGAQGAVGIPQSGFYPTSVDPWEIIIYDQPNYVGNWIRYRMEPGMRQLLVYVIYQGWDTKVVSVQVGSNVGVVFYPGPFFSIQGSNLYAGSGQKETKYESWAPRVQVDYKINSFIIYPKAAYGPIGVRLWHESQPTFSVGAQAADTETFFPLPEMEANNEYVESFLGDQHLDKRSSALCPSPGGFGKFLQIVLYDQRDYGGNMMVLPGANGWEGSFNDVRNPSCEGVNFGQFGWTDRVASLKVRWIGPKLGLGPPPPPPVHISVQAAPTTIDISGRWQSNIGLIYDISQSDTKFKWVVIKATEQGAGDIDGKNIKAFWTDGRSTFSGQGKIVAVDAQNKATRIEWDNGVVFFR